ncbi:MAG: hypothetical protein H0W64_01175 [Gammaproteobacteria bacterium]|nr:hypothetical protein [Gammaproteobacteria bacterium]
MTQPLHRPYKSVAVALIFCVLLGPVGLLYASFWGGLVMMIIGVIVVSSKLYFCILLFWMSCCLWGVAAAESFNRKNYQASIAHQERIYGKTHYSSAA